MLFDFLIVLFMILILFQLFDKLHNNMEGFEDSVTTTTTTVGSGSGTVQSSTPIDSSGIEVNNSTEIEQLKLENTDLQKQIDDLNKQVTELHSQLDNISQQQIDAANEIPKVSTSSLDGLS
jgi:peptidoglycan hydrolase CwlO-like protein